MGFLTSYRNFDGTNDSVHCAMGACECVGAMSVFVVARRGVDGADQCLIAGHTSAGTGRWAFETLTTDALWWQSGGTGRAGPSIAVADGWCLLGVTRTAGTTTPRFHKFVYATNTWTHSDAASTTGNPLTTAGGTIRFGEHQNIDDFTGDIAASVLYNGATLSDSQVEDLAFSYDAWWAFGPAGLWRFDSPCAWAKVRDLTGKGADETVLNGTTRVTYGVVPGLWVPEKRRVRRAARLFLPNDANNGGGAAATLPHHLMLIGCGI
jgi:hypothetical protein